MLRNSLSGVAEKLSTVLAERNVPVLVNRSNPLQEYVEKENTFELPTYKISNYKIMNSENPKETRQQRRKKERELKKKRK